MNTSLKCKEKFWPDFIRACESQWKMGGKRYALAEDKEFTDLVCEVGGETGDTWIGQNIVKYIGEIINTEKFSGKVPEVNFFKIAVYAFIWWLKKKEKMDNKDRGEEFTLYEEEKNEENLKPLKSTCHNYKMFPLSTFAINATGYLIDVCKGYGCIKCGKPCLMVKKDEK